MSIQRDCLLIAEHLANCDDALCEKYLADVHPSTSDLHSAIRRAVCRRAFVPVLMGSALHNKGVQTMLDAVVRYLPNPSEIVNRASLYNKSVQVVLEICELRPRHSSGRSVGVVVAVLSLVQRVEIGGGIVGV